MPPSVPPTFNLLTSHFTTFLTVAIHSILYERQIYPAISFLSARRYNFPVRQNRHPKVCEWINDAVAAVEAELLRGTVARVVLVLFEVTNACPTERWVFDVEKFPFVPEGRLDAPLVYPGEHIGENSEAEAGADAERHLPLVDLEEQFRATLSRLATCAQRLRPPASPSASSAVTTSFTLAIELKETGDPPIRHPQAWMAGEEKQQRSDEREGSRDGNANAVWPVRAVKAGDMMFEAWVEEVPLPVAVST